MYFIWYTLQCVYITLSGTYIYITYSVSMISMEVVVNDIKLLRLSIKEMDQTIKSIQKNNRCYTDLQDTKMNVFNKSNINYCFPEDKLRLMKTYTRYIVITHQLIYRKINVIKKGIQGISFALKCGVCVYACSSIYYIIKKDSMTQKMLETFLCGFTFYILYVFDVRGERIITEWENLRNALYECSWISKPDWFKKALLIIMTRNNKPIEIKPFGLMVLNLRNFAASVNDAESKIRGAFVAILKWLKKFA
ncbi:uncharacterized protein LOC142332783 [Lycorma delicatula]|uniref:uncharacterized protein LOC142332783 n=1 Tax=Lycorma delicatula TaxID=130591 RepID=UPI003F515C08